MRELAQCVQYRQLRMGGGKEGQGQRDSPANDWFNSEAGEDKKRVRKWGRKGGGRREERCEHIEYYQTTCTK